MAMRKRLRVKKVLRHGAPKVSKITPISDPFPADLVTDDVPVISPGKSVPGWTAIIAVIINMIVMLASAFGHPVDQEHVNTILVAFDQEHVTALLAVVNSILGVFAWIYEMFFKKNVTITSLDPEEKKAMRRV